MHPHQWIFDEFTDDDKWQAVLFSFQSNKKKRRLIPNTLLLSKIISILSSSGHYLFPFDLRSYSESIANELSQSPVLIYKKMSGVDDVSVAASYDRFIRKLEIMQKVHINESALRDLNVIAELLHLCYSQSERFCVIRCLWQNATKYKNETRIAVHESSLNNVPLWDPYLTTVIALYL